MLKFVYQQDIYRAWREVKMKFIPACGNVNYFYIPARANPNLLYDIRSMCMSKVCLERGYIHSAGTQVNMMIIPVPGKVYYIQAMPYCAISLQSFMQKMIQKLVTRNIREETLGHVYYIYSNLPTNRGSTQKTECIMFLRINREQWKTGS
jgi:hypothetical protein